VSPGACQAGGEGVKSGIDLSKHEKLPRKKKEPFLFIVLKENTMPSSLSSIAHWQQWVTELLPNLSTSHAMNLGLLSYAMVLLDGCGMTRLSNGLAKIEQVPTPRLRQRLREFYYEAEDKRGKKRRAVEVQDCFEGLLRGILRGWEGKKEIALTLDASTLGKRFTVLNLSVMYRGCGIPIAWKILVAGQAGAWRPIWESFIKKVSAVIPKEWKVIVMADRGLYAKWLYEAIVAVGWHPFLRVKEEMSFRAQGAAGFGTIGRQVQRHGRKWGGRGQWGERGELMEGTLLVRWEQGYKERLAVVTDLPVEQGEGAWYQMRFWVEAEYKDHKSGGLRWDETKMEDPQRAERLWLAMAVAMQRMVLVGGQEDASVQERTERLARSRPGKRRVGRPAKAWKRPRGREQSCLMQGQQSIQAAALRGEALPQGHVMAEEWPKETFAIHKTTAGWAKKEKVRRARQRHTANRQTRAQEQERTSPKEQRTQTRQRERQEQRAKVLQKREQAKQERDAAQRQSAPTQPKSEPRHLRKQEKREEREREKAQQREEHQRAKEARVQDRLERQQWHEEIARDRAERQRQKEAGGKRQRQAPPACLSAAFQIVVPREAFAPLPKPP
jgi:hypothetical protein